MTGGSFQVSLSHVNITTRSRGRRANDCARTVCPFLTVVLDDFNCVRREFLKKAMEMRKHHLLKGNTGRETAADRGSTSLGGSYIRQHKGHLSFTQPPPPGLRKPKYALMAGNPHRGVAWVRYLQICRLSHGQRRREQAADTPSLTRTVRPQSDRR